MQWIAVPVYLAAIVAANILISHFGPESAPVIGFLFVGLDLSLRDALHDVWSGGLLWKMGALIAAGGLFTWAVQPSASMVAVASTAAFVGAAVADTVVYDWFIEQPYLARANASNLAGAVVDSVVFITVAFGSFLWWVILLQVGSKVLGGAFWAWVIDRAGWREVAVAGLFAAVAVPAGAQDLYVTTHYDVRRQQPIAAVVHDTPLPGKFFSTGYVEVWRNSESVGYPEGEWTLFSKHWITYPLTSRLSASLELSFMLNRPGVAFQWPEEAVFTPGDRRLHFTPKIGVSYQIY